MNRFTAKKIITRFDTATLKRVRSGAFTDMLVSFCKFGQPIDKITAIKLHRAMFSLGVKESKDAVEAIEVKVRKQYPNLFAQRAPSPARVS